MAKDGKKMGGDDPVTAREPEDRGSVGAGHHAAKAHGQPATVDASLPVTRDELMTLHAAARARRNAAPLGGDDFRTAVEDLERIEVRIAAIDRAHNPPLG